MSTGELFWAKILRQWISPKNFNTGIQVGGTFDLCVYTVFIICIIYQQYTHYTDRINTHYVRVFFYMYIYILHSRIFKYTQ
jgi:uncharacterized membrane protein YobD (UPF0266 family)